MVESGVWLPLLAAPGLSLQLLVHAVILLCLFSLLPGWMQWCLSSAWRMRSASRRSTTTTCGSAATGTQRRCRWCWWAHRVRAVPGLPPHPQPQVGVHGASLGSTLEDPGLSALQGAEGTARALRRKFLLTPSQLPHRELHHSMEPLSSWKWHNTLVSW